LLKKKQRNILVFIPSIEGGGVEKNLFLIINFLIKNNFNIVLITANPESKKKFHKKITIISPQNQYSRNFSRYKKYFYCLFLLFKFLSNNNFTVLSFQANLYAIIVAKLLCKKIIIRSNSSPSGWSQNPIKRIIYKILFKLADSIIVNSKDFAKQMYEIFNVKCKVIYNPLNKEEIIKKSKERFFNKFLYKNKNFFKIISIGRFVDQKDHLTLLKAFQIIYKKINAKLILMGQGIKKGEYLQFIKNNNLQNDVLILKFNNQTYNIGAEKYYSINEIATIVQNIGIKFGYHSNIEYGEARHEVKHAYCDHTKAIQDLNFTDNTNINELIENVFTWAMSQPSREVKNMNYEVDKNIYKYWQ